MSDKTVNGTDSVPFKMYEKLEGEILRMVDMLMEVGIRTNEVPKDKAINIRWLQQKLVNEISAGNFNADSFKTVNRIIGEWKESKWKF